MCFKEVPPLGFVAETGYLCPVLAVKISADALCRAEACTARRGLTAGMAASAG